MTKKHSATRPEFRARVERLQSDLLLVEEARRAAHAAMLAEAALTIAEAVRDEYATMKRARGVLDYDDLIVKTQLLERGDAAAWVLYKLDGGIDHVLIDEAQDTSPEQWRIVKALTAEFFAGAANRRRRHAHHLRGGRREAVDLQLPGRRSARVRPVTAAFPRRGAGRQARIHQPLTQSRRSVPQVLQFVDAVFAPEDARKGLTSDSAALHHEAHRAQESGRVEFWPSDQAG